MTARIASLLLMCLLCLQPAVGSATAPNGGLARSQLSAASAPNPDDAFGRLPLYFVENQGQTDPQVAFYLLGGGTQIWFTRDDVTFAIPDQTVDPEPAGEPFQKWSSDMPSESEPQRRWVVKLDFVGANPATRPVGEEEQETIVSYFRGSPNEWHAGMHTYARIVYRNLWPGIDLAYYGKAGQLKYDFLIHPGADPAQIRLRYRGADAVALNKLGQMEISTPFGSFTDDKPVSWQELNGRHVPVVSAFRPMDATRTATDSGAIVGFSVGNYERAKPLVIDPTVIAYCGYIGESGQDQGNSVAVDNAGNAYVTGQTYAEPTGIAFPEIVGPDLTYNGGWDAFVVKVNASGASLDYAGYIGGKGWDFGTGIAVDGDGSAYVTGYTQSPETSFPVRKGPDLTFNGTTGYDAFVVKVNPSGVDLAYAGYIGGADSDFGYGIAVDGVGDAYVTGFTYSTEVTFPVKVGPDPTYNGGEYDAFVAKVSSASAALVYAGYIGGPSYERGFGIAIDDVGNAYVTGYTWSGSGFPVKVGPDLTHNGGDQDAFIAKVAASGTALVYAGYIGGSGWDEGSDIAVDSAGGAYVVGTTNSTQATFPKTRGPDLTFNGIGDAFIAKINASGASLDYAGYIGGSESDLGSGVAVDSAGNAYVSGSTNSTGSTFPAVGGPDLSYNGGITDAFVAKVNTSGEMLIYAGYIGGSEVRFCGTGSERGSDIAVDNAGNAYITGETCATETDEIPFPVVGGPDLTYGGRNDAFIAKISSDSAPPVAYSISGQVAYHDGSPITGVTISVGVGHDDTTDASGNYTLPGLPRGTYTLTAAKNEYKFKQSFSGGVTVPPDAKNKDFTGWKTCDPPAEPFLDLPFAYDRTDAAYNFKMELANWNIGGVTAWFDHHYPTYDRLKDGLQLYFHTGGVVATSANNNGLYCHGPISSDLCYDGHNGTDMIPKLPYTTGIDIILAAAGGGVAAVCKLDSDCSSSYPADHVFPFDRCYGNYVVMDHANGYFTLYGHMSLITVSPIKSITGGTPIGSMGNTSGCNSSFGDHLHFGVYCDDGNGRWDGEKIDRPVDPFGWEGRLSTPAVEDPWVSDEGMDGPVSGRLWMYPDQLICPIVSTGPTTCSDPTDAIHAQVAVGTLPSGSQLIVSRSPVASPPVQLLTAGASFRLRTGTPTGSAVLTTNSEPAALPQPITLQVTWDATASRHLNMGQTVLYARSEGSEAWRTLVTTADQGDRTAQAQTTELGDFDLRAPLLCPDGDMEPNDDYSQAWATASETAPASGTFDISDDEDWYRVDMNAGRSYTLQTSALGASVDTILELYDTNGATRLKSDDNGGGGTASRLEWIPGHSGTYFVKVARTTGGAFGCTTSYRLGISSVAVGGQSLYLPLIMR